MVILPAHVSDLYSAPMPGTDPPKTLHALRLDLDELRNEYSNLMQRMSLLEERINTHHEELKRVKAALPPQPEECDEPTAPGVKPPV